MAKLIRWSTFALFAALGLSGCGGGTLGEPEGGEEEETTVTTLTLLPSSNVLPANVDDPADPSAVIVTAVARDQNNNVVEGIPVTFSANNGGSLLVTEATTQSDGRATAILDTGGDPTLRPITVTVRGGGRTATTVIQVISPTTGAAPASLVVLLESPQLSSSATTAEAGVELTAVVKDTGNNVVQGVAVSFTTPDSGEIIVLDGETDENGRATASLNTGGDPTNRTIRVFVTAGALQQVVNVSVIGTTIAISGPAATQIGTPTQYTAQLTDSEGDGIPNRIVTFTTNNGAGALSATSVVTDAGGLATVTLTPALANSTLTASAVGLTATQAITVSTDVFVFETPAEDAELPIGANRTVRIRWTRGGAPMVGEVINFASTRGVFNSPTATTDANGRASVSIRSTQSGFSTLVATASGPNPPSVTRQVEFVATTPTQIELQARPATVGTNQSSDLVAVVRDATNNLVKNQTVEFQLSDSTAGVLSQPTAVTNSQGVATVRYNASSQSSPTQSVVVEAKVRGTDPVVRDTTNLTVGGSAVSIKLGTGAEIEELNVATYKDPWSVLVVDSRGTPVSSAEFRLQIQPSEYAKGTFGGVIWCPNEDLNLNDILDPGEDLNGNGLLEPGRPMSVPSEVPLDPATGNALFHVVYPKSFGGFIRAELFGIATVSGTETVERRTFVLRIAEDDFENLPGISPYGVELDCTNPN